MAPTSYIALQLHCKSGMELEVNMADKEPGSSKEIK